MTKAIAKRHFDSLCYVMRKRVVKLYFWFSHILIFILLVIHHNAFANDQESQENDVRIYYTPEERRHAGERYKVFEDLTIFSLLEAESVLESFGFADSAERFHTDESSLTLQSGLEYTPLDWFKGEIIYEIEAGNKVNHNIKHIIDEAIAAFEYDDYSLEVGRITAPFGEYFSHFITGPALEFAETITDGLVMSYDMDDRYEVAAYLFKPEYKKHCDLDLKDWGVSAMLAVTEDLLFGAGYISNISDYQREVSEDTDLADIHKLSAFNAFSTLEADSVFFTAEWVKTLDSYLDEDENSRKPWAINFECSYAFSNDLELAIRFERSFDLSDEPAKRYGAATTYRLNDSIVWTTEILYGNYNNFVVDSPREGVVDDNILLATQIIYGF